MSSRSSISKFHSRLSLFILGIFAFTALCASAQQGRLTGDAQTSTNRPNKNLGGSQSLEVIGGSDRVFVKFSLPENLPPGTVGAHVGKATLKLFVNTVNNPGALGVAGVTSAWSESTITNATAPTIGALVGSVNIDATQQNQWIALDVTSIVQGWIDNAGSNNGVVLFAAAGGPDVLFDSKESQTTSHQPQLEIVLNHAATADNATNAATAANATQLGGVPAGNFALKSDPVAAGSPNYIQNTTVQQPLSNFNISGNGTVGGTLTANTLSLNIVNANTQFNLGGQRFAAQVGSALTSSTFLGNGAGQNEMPFADGQGHGNIFIGDSAGKNNVAGSENSFVGFNAGFNNIGGSFNDFFGHNAGFSNNTGNSNAFFGGFAGLNLKDGSENTVLGIGAGSFGSTGNDNTFVGFSSGSPSTLRAVTNIGTNNTLLGANTTLAADALDHAAAIGADAVANASNTIVLGRSAGQDTVQVPGALSVNTFSANVLNAGSQFNLGGAHILSTAGFQNTFLGVSAGLKNSSSFNSFFGTLAGTENTTGLGNSFFGDTAGQKNTTGSHNSSFGSGAGFINVTASDNSMYGYHAGVVSTGGLNSFFGSLAGSSNTTGNRNTFVGDAAGTSNTDGQDNNFFGAAAGGFNTIGARNSFFGLFAGFDNRTGADNTALGANADVASDNLNFATAIGAGAVVSSSNTIVLGRSAGQDTVQVPGSLSVNTFSANILNAGSQFNLGGNRVIGFENAVNAENLYIGPGAGAASAPSQISGFKGAFQNTFLGISAGGDTTIGTLDTFVGFETGLNNTTEDANSYFGTWAGRNATGGSFNSFFGRSAGFSEAGDNNSYFGYVAGSGATGQRNSMFGSEAGERASSGDDNAFFGFGAGFHNNANHNAFFGSFAGTATSTGAENTFVGFQAGKTNLAGTSNTLLGSGADVAADGLTNATAIGAGAVVGQSNALILGNNVNVGIGTSTPGSRLTVAGLVESTTGGVKFPDGSIQTTAATGAAGPVVKSLNGLNNDIILAAGTSNVTITPSGNTLSISVAASSGGGILNQTFLQTGANFNIDGTGTAGILNAQTQYNLGGARVLSAPFQDNLFIGKGTGVNSNPSGDNIENVFTGTSSGASTTECCNAFFGNFTGQNNTDGSGNTFLGYQAGKTNTHGGANTFVGENAGNLHTTGNANTFIGTLAGVFDSTGSNNTSIGAGSGGGVLTQPPNGSPGTFNTFLGANATASQQDFTYATAIGANAIVTASNTVVIGRPADTVSIPGTLTKAAGSFKIDDPIDPANKTLSHSFVESPDMMNVYNGNIVTDERGEAVVTMPEWFEALNRDFRYQLTVIGQFAQAIIAAEMKDNRFAIKTDKPNVKVSWQVTGIRHDAYANAHRIPVEEAKPAAERGSYLFPGGFKGPTQ